MSEGFRLHDFQQVVAGEAAAVTACAASLAKEGWALVRFPSDVAQKAAVVARQLEAFFGQEAPAKTEYNLSTLLGYNSGAGACLSSVLFSLTWRHQCEGWLPTVRTVPCSRRS